MDKHLRVKKEAGNIVPLRFDASLFFKCAVKYLDRKEYHKALRYFRRTLEHESDNPINYFNLAGVLSEMGKFEESNHILETLVTEISPKMHECYYYMANNSANMGDFESAEIYTLKYIEAAPEGEYIEEAKELLDFISFESNYSPLPEGAVNNALKLQHVKARKLLEDGCFLEAVRLLENMVLEYPEFTPAQNNLSLAYYYTGKMEKAVSTAIQVLEKEKGNIHALCNLAVFYRQMNGTEEEKRLVRMLKNIHPFDVDQMFKLATTLGILGEHQVARRWFLKLHKYQFFNKDVTLFHYTAVSSFNLKHLAEAKKWWEKVKIMDPESFVAPFYLEYLQRVEEGREEWREVFYQYHLPIDEYFDMAVIREEEGIPKNLKKNPLVRSSLLWALKHGDQDTKLQVIQAFAYFSDQESEKVLREYLLQKDEEDELKMAAVFVLKMIGAKEPYRAVIKDREVVMDSNALPESLNYWIQKRQSVIHCFQKRMKGRYEVTEHHEAYRLWMEFISKVYPSGPTIRKAEGWAAAVEYIVANNHNKTVTQKDVAERYGVSPSTVAKHAKQLKDMCR